MCPAGPPIPETPLSSRLEANLGAVRARIAAACSRTGRDPGEVCLVAVTKTVSPPVAAALVALGQLDLGESRVQVLETKRAWFEEHGIEARWHLIGHLQRNKARRGVQLADRIHSVDSLRLLETLDRVAGEEGATARVHLEVKLAGGTERTGLAPEELADAARLAIELAHVRPVGLMTMAAPPPADAAGTFRALRRLRDGLAAEGLAEGFEQGRAELSMGMSSDLEAAVAEGSDLVRVGTSLFEGLDAEGEAR